ncbi:hypothetical protein [Actinoplanes cyaneus]|nr:hypothetical protein [Actinoplanes cyaneus]
MESGTQPIGGVTILMVAAAVAVFAIPAGNTTARPGIVSGTA